MEKVDPVLKELKKTWLLLPWLLARLVGSATTCRTISGHPWLIVRSVAKQCL